MAKRHSWPGRLQTPSTVHGLSFLSLPPLPHSIVSPTFLFPAQTPCRNMGVTYLPPHLKRRLISASRPTTPLSTIEYLLLPRHGLALRQTRQRRGAPPRRRHPRCCCSRR